MYLEKESNGDSAKMVSGKLTILSHCLSGKNIAKTREFVLYYYGNKYSNTQYIKVALFIIM